MSDFDLNEEIELLEDMGAGPEKYTVHASAHAQAAAKYLAKAKMCPDKVQARQLRKFARNHKSAAEALTGLANDHAAHRFTQQSKVKSVMSEDLQEAAVYKHQGQEVSGVKTTKVENPSYHKEKHDVHLDGEHIGHVYMHETSQFMKPNSIRMQSGGKLRKRWGYNHKDGDHYSLFGSKKDAVEELLGHHIRHHKKTTNEETEVNEDIEYENEGIRSLIAAAIEQRAVDFRNGVQELIRDRAVGALEDLKVGLAEIFDGGGPGAPNDDNDNQEASSNDDDDELAGDEPNDKDGSDDDGGDKGNGGGTDKKVKGSQKNEAYLDESRDLNRDSVKHEKIAGGKTVTTLSRGHSFSVVLHPEHKEAINKLGHGESHTFKDETGARWKATHNGSSVHFKHQGQGYEHTVDSRHLHEEVIAPTGKTMVKDFSDNVSGQDDASMEKIQNPGGKNVGGQGDRAMKKLADKPAVKNISEVSNAILDRYFKRNEVDEAHSDHQLRQATRYHETERDVFYKRARKSKELDLDRKKETHRAGRHEKAMLTGRKMMTKRGIKENPSRGSDKRNSEAAD